MITYFIGKVEDAYASTYTKKDTGEIIEQVEITATYRQRAKNGKLYMHTEHFRFTSDHPGIQINDMKNATGKYIVVPFERRQFGQTVTVALVRDLTIQLLDFDPLAKKETKEKEIKKAS